MSPLEAMRENGSTIRTRIQQPCLVTMPWTVSDSSSGMDLPVKDVNVLPVDPPFFQKETDSSNEGKGYAYNHLEQSNIPRVQSSSAGDYRSVIDDLTIEIQRLKEELKRYKQSGPDMLRKEELFEIKVHGLPSRKKRELEATLRDFASGLDGSEDTTSYKRRKGDSHHAKYARMDSASGSMSKEASSLSGSRPADSAYASMSTGANSSGRSLSRPSIHARGELSDQKVENYLRDIPEGLYPQHMALTDKERKSLVVRRLEQLFTGKISGRRVRGKMPGSVAVAKAAVPSASNAVTSLDGNMMHQPPSLLQHEASREAKILTSEQQPGPLGKKSGSRDNGSVSNSNEDQTDSSGTNPSPPLTSRPEQRPTRPKDLDPNRVQVPSENMDYIRHLGLIPPELLEHQPALQNVHPDADGWVYLNLLCSMAQLHIINVTPSFVRASVTELSTKFQLSPDGRKIRWRGGTEGTKFNSDSSGYTSQKSPSTDDTDGGAIDGHKRKKTSHSTSDELRSGRSSKHASKSGPQVSASSGSFHYKPLFAHRESGGGTMSPEATVSSFGPAEDSNLEESRYGISGSGSTARKKRRRDGAIIYYSGAPFCTDLSGDTGDLSPTAQLAAGAQEAERRFARPCLERSNSGSHINYKPLADRGHLIGSSSRMEVDGGNGGNAESTDDNNDDLSDVELELTWSDTPQYFNIRPLEPCGIGGVLPDDHFMVVIATKRSKQDASAEPKMFDEEACWPEATSALIRRLRNLPTSSPVLAATNLPSFDDPSIEIEYTSGRIKRLTPVALPPPAIFYPPVGSDESASTDWMSGSDEEIDIESSDFVISRLQPHHSHDYPDGVDLSSGDEEGEEPEDSPEGRHMYDNGNRQAGILKVLGRRTSQQSSSAAAAAGTMQSKSTSVDPMVLTDGSSVATAGGAKSGYNSEEGEEEEEDGSS